MPAASKATGLSLKRAAHKRVQYCRGGSVTRPQIAQKFFGLSSMSHAHFHFHGDLNFFLPRQKRDTTFTHNFDWRGSVKDMIESLGVPHPEIELITVSGASVDFDYIVRHGDQIDVYHSADAIELPHKIALRPPLPEYPAFILDQHLGRLAAYLRMLGFDTLYRNDYHDEELARVSHEENRVLLTRDIGLLKRGIVVYGYFVRETNRHRQLAEIARRFNLADLVVPYKRCMKCNGLVHPVEKQAVAHQLMDGTAEHYNEFHQCENCHRVYWKGPHHQRMQTLIEDIIEGNNNLINFED
jgi:uncharacterized protein